MIALLGLLLLGPPPAESTTPPEQARAAASASVKAADDLRAKGDAASLRAATAEYLKAISTCRTLRDSGCEASAQNKLGRAYDGLKEWRAARAAYDRALPLFRAAGDRDGEASALTNIGSVEMAEGHPLKAVDWFKQSLEKRKELNLPKDEANTWHWLGQAFDALHQPAAALDAYRQAAERYGAAGDRALEGRVLRAAGVVAFNNDDDTQALALHRAGLAASQAAGDKAGAAISFHDIGLVQDHAGDPLAAIDAYRASLATADDDTKESREITLRQLADALAAVGRNDEALKTFEEALTLDRELRDRDGEATVLNGLGSIYTDLGQKTKAIELYRQAMAIYRSKDLRDKSGEATELSNIGLALADLGRFKEALDSYNQALPLRQGADRATLLMNMASAYDSIDEVQRALDLHNEALTLYRSQKQPDKDGVAAALSNLAGLYWRLDDDARAEDLYRQSLDLYRSLSSASGEASVLSSLGDLRRDVDDEAGALDLYEQALRLYEQIGERGGIAFSQLSIGRVQADLKRYAEAIDSDTRALTIFQDIGDPSGAGQALSARSNAKSWLDDRAGAIADLGSALPLLRRASDYLFQATALRNLAINEQAVGDLVTAKGHIEEAIKIIDGLRTKVASQQLRTSYFATFSDYYGTQIDVLMDLHRAHPSEGYDRAALTAVEAGRARGLLDLLGEARADLRRGVPPALLAREQAIQDQLDTLAAASGRGDPAAVTRLEALVREHDDIETQIRRSSPGYSSLKNPEPVTVDQVQSILDADTVLLEYALKDGASYVWAVTKSSVRAYRLPAKDVIEAQARQVVKNLTAPARHLLTTPSKQRDDLNALSASVLAPLAQELAAHRLVIVADGALTSVPFATLPAPGLPDRYLAAEHEISNLPSVSALVALRKTLERRTPPTKSIAVLADPIFSAADDRVMQHRTGTVQTTDASVARVELNLAAKDAGRAGSGSFERLPGTLEEARAILNLSSATAPFIKVGAEATRELVMGGALAPFRYVHFATHGVLDSEHPELSGLVLSLVDRDGHPVNGFLRLNDIFNLRLAADVVVLSACETGLGRQIRGEGLVGITRGFMYAGVPRVVVSLWQVSDAATAQFMQLFYRGVLERHQTVAAALREAGVTMAHDPAHPQWQDPYYWAAFTLQGEWR